MICLSLSGGGAGTSNLFRNGSTEAGSDLYRPSQREEEGLKNPKLRVT